MSKQPNEVQHDTPNPLTVVTIRVVEVEENLLKFADCPSRDKELKESSRRVETACCAEILVAQREKL